MKRNEPVANKRQLLPFERNGFSSVLFLETIFVPLDSHRHASHQLRQALLVNAARAQHTKSTANLARWSTGYQNQSGNVFIRIKSSHDWSAKLITKHSNRKIEKINEPASGLDNWGGLGAGTRREYTLGDGGPIPKKSKSADWNLSVNSGSR